MSLSMELVEFLNGNNYVQSIFRTAIYNSDEKLVRQLVKSYKNLKDQVLHVAAHLGNVQILERYILFGADVNKEGTEEDNCFTPLQRAVSANQLQVVKYLVQRGADVNSCYEEICHGNCSILNIAINNHPGNLDMIHLLLSNGADTNISCDRCYTPLAKAIKDHQYEIIEVLIKYNADVNLPCIFFGEKVTPLYMAVKENQFGTIKLLLSRNANLNAITPYKKQSILQGAIPFVGLDILKYLLSAGVDVNCEDSRHKTVLELAVQKYYNFTSTIKEHLVKMKAADLYLSERNLKVINSQNFDTILNTCLEEVDLMKKCRIAHTTVTFYELLHTSEQSVALRFKCVEEKNIVNYREKFPLYADLIDFRLKRVLIKQDRLRNVNLFFEDVFYNILPNTFIRNISCYLDENFVEQLNKNLQK